LGPLFRGHDLNPVPDSGSNRDPILFKRLELTLALDRLGFGEELPRPVNRMNRLDVTSRGHNHFQNDSGSKSSSFAVSRMNHLHGAYVVTPEVGVLDESRRLLGSHVLWANVEKHPDKSQ
jgi:hypothetical protein